MMSTFAFIDASNIIYGTRDEGWKVDFKKLYKYLKERYECKTIYYFGGKDEQNEKQFKFYREIEKMGFELVLKPVKIFRQSGGKPIRKANCDVDLTFYAMRDKDKFSRIIMLSGDGDFEILLRYFMDNGKSLVIIANGSRTAKEIKQLVRGNFTDLKSLRSVLEYKK